ncbi:MAG TPA: ABC transporter ATP-binding protein [Firmicutes bacterium]|jgi:biotin transport system ATP-binding protein|nr:ABC transporter ATP-binding protein [Bacillota bacterium]HBG43963.1 ABC transporter ATP-binding protein [Bacillota bacterium]HBR22963.1 ABC transporter ATP-binding protein [Bacillota bacterium]HCF89682.1 ABC transporter ATP-binding protein [Bacillota bacterium]
MSILTTKNLTHTFPDGTTGIADISLQFGAGEFVIIAGANGSGKTVFIRHLNGLLTPTRGKVLIDGVPITKNITATRRKIGLIFQDSDSQIVGQTVAEDVAFGPENLNLSPPEVEQAVAEALRATGLEDLSGKDPRTLSGGQKKKLAIAGVLAMQPEILIFDEPFTGLDYPGVVQILQQIVQLHQAGHTILLVTHELEKVLAHADRLIILHQGKLVEDGAPQEVIYRAANYGVRVPLKDGEEVSSVTWLK